jgi:NAD(P)-dependent dehydrogenase (short-subunit alcohol dehydrogenase family)
MDQLRGKVAVVTGAASGIGLAMAHSFAGEGMRLVLADVDEPGLHTARAGLAELGADAVTVPTDVSDPDAVDALRDAAMSAFGGAHVVCNNAGVGGGGLIWEVPLETWRWVFSVNFWGVVHGIRSFVPLMLEQGEGHVVNTASAAGLMVAPWMGPYTATKHAVVAVSETLALDLGDAPVGVSVLCPMFVRTRIHESDRTAPPEVLRAEEARGGATEGMRDMMAGLVNAGIEPAIVGEMVRAAVQENRFWILPHDEVKPAMVGRAQRVAHEVNPAFSAELFGQI